MDVGTISSDDLIASYKRQLVVAIEQIAMLEAALARSRRDSEGASAAIQQIDNGRTGGIGE